VATQPEDLQEQEQTEQVDGVLTPDGDGHEDQQDQQEAPPPPPSVEDVAKAIGWVPQENYHGDPAKWRPAHEYIIAGREIQQRSSQELREIKQTLDTVVKTSAQIAADRLEAQRQELTRQFQSAVDEGDPRAAYEASQKLGQVDQQLRQTQTPTPPQDVSAFAAKNANWFQVDPAATALAVGISNANAHLPVAQQLEKAEAEVRRVYPHLFSDSVQPQAPQPKPQAQVRQPASRSSQPAARAKGFSDMPPAAQKVALDMADRGVLPNKEAYAINYWKTIEGAANNG
jgi:hypothetical protein